jgi:hypothetical protein
MHAEGEKFNIPPKEFPSCFDVMHRDSQMERSGSHRTIFQALFSRISLIPGTLGRRSRDEYRVQMRTAIELVSSRSLTVKKRRFRSSSKA